MDSTTRVTVDTPWWTVDDKFVTVDGTLLAERADRADLLPGNATPLERAIAAVDGRLDDLDAALVRAVRDLDACPDWALPYLAWERSVDVWDPAWPADVKRAVVRMAPEVHRYKGTVRAVKAALAALKVDAVVTEWWQTEPRGAPYTFHVALLVRTPIYDGPVVDDRLIRVGFASVMAAKPLSRAFSYSAGVTFPRRLGLAAGGTARARLLRPARARFALHPAVRLGLAPAAIARQTVRAAFHARTA